MPELDTIEIVSWKDPTQMWRINRDEYDPAKHTLWGERHVDAQQEKAPQAEAEAEALEIVSDFMTDGTGSITQVAIVNPNDKRARKVIPGVEYDPDTHVLWSERSKR